MGLYTVCLKSYSCLQLESTFEETSEKQGEKLQIPFLKTKKGVLPAQILMNSVIVLHA